MNNWVEVRTELDLVLEMEREAARLQRKQTWIRLSQHSKQLHTLFARSVQWLGISHTVSTHG